MCRLKKFSYAAATSASVTAALGTFTVGVLGGFEDEQEASHDPPAITITRTAQQRFQAAILVELVPAVLLIMRSMISLSQIRRMPARNVPCHTRCRMSHQVSSSETPYRQLRAEMVLAGDGAGA